MILQNNDIYNNLFVYNELIKEKKDKVLLKNNIIFLTENIDLKLLGQSREVLLNSDDHLFYLVNNPDQTRLTSEINFEKLSTQLEINYNTLDDFKFQKIGFFSKGNVRILYFSSRFVRNPLDVIDQIVSTISLEGEYHDVKIDYLLTKNKIIYYLLFRYSFEPDRNIDEMKNVKAEILKFKKYCDRQIIFPEVQLKFQELHLSQFEDINSLDNGLIYEGSSLFTPFYKLKGSVYENI